MAALALAACAQGFDAERADRGTVRIEHVFDDGGKELLGAHGSGFIITGAGHVVTNRHVVFLEDRVPKGLKYKGLFVVGATWGQRLKAKVLWSSKELDLAVLQVDGLRRGPVALSALAPTVIATAGRPVYAVGYPGAGDSVDNPAALVATFTQGQVSKVAPGRAGPGETERPLVQHSAAMNPGSSGGPLFNACNQVVGLNSFRQSGNVQVAKGPGGRYVAHSSTISGTAFSTHISALIQRLKSEPELKGLAVTITTQPCTGAAALPMELLVAVAVIGALALVSMLLALVRRRGAGEVMKVVESYSQIIRRTPGRRTGPEGRPQPAAPRLTEAAAASVWTLAGATKEGQAVRLQIDPQDLAGSGEGDEGGVIIGRSHALATKVIDDPSISRRHARIVAAEGGIAVEDLNSTFGTRVNGNAIEPYAAVRLDRGARLQLGDVALDVTGPAA